MHINVCLLFEWMDMITSGFFAFHFICLELRSFRENEPFFKPELVFVVVVVRVTGAKWPFFLFSACCIGVRPQSMRSHCGWLCFFLLGWCKEYTASYDGAECGEWRCIKEENDSLPYCIIHCFCFFLFLRLLLVWALNSETMWLCTGFFWGTNAQHTGILCTSKQSLNIFDNETIEVDGEYYNKINFMHEYLVDRWYHHHQCRPQPCFVCVWVVNSYRTLSTRVSVWFSTWILVEKGQNEDH